MTIASAIQAKQQQVADSYTAVSNKGGTLPATQNLTNLATAISTIPTGGSAPVITSLNVTPTTSAQTITAPSGTDGYSPINVAAVTAAIDSDIKASNIKSGVSILGVTGTVTELNGETRTATLTSSAGNTFTPSSGKNAITSITVTPNNQARSITPSTSAQTLNINSGYSGNGIISVSAVTSSIDANILPENIKKDVTILSVTGTYEGSGGGGSKYGATINTVLGDADANGVLQKPTEQSELVFTGVKDISSYALYTRFYEAAITSVSFPNLTTISGSYGMNTTFFGCTSLTSVSFPNLTTISGSYGMNNTFDGCTSLTSVSFPKLTTIGSNGMRDAFYSCNSLASVSFPKLTTIGNSGMKNAFRSCHSLASVSFLKLTTIRSNGMDYAFQGCVALTSVSFPELTTIGNSGMNYAFDGCTSLTSVSFPKLTTIGSNGMKNAFQGCSKIANIYFNKVTTSTFATNKNQFMNMFNPSTASTSGTVNVHFPSNLSSTVSGLTGYPAFGGNSSRVVLKFDLPATS